MAIILPPKYSIVYTLSEGDPALFGICETRDEKQLYGLADSNGTILIEPQDKWTYSVPMYSCGYCVVNYRYRQYDPESGDYTDSSPNSLIDEKGNEIPLPYEVTDSQFYDGFLLVRDPERTAYLNTDLEEVLSLDISFEEYSASPLIDGIVAVTKDIGSHTYVIDQDGELICEMTDSRLHDDFGVFSEGTCWARTVSETEGGSFLYFDPRLKDYTSPWAAAEMDRAQAAGLVTESNDSYFTFRITRRRFAELMANLVEKTTGRSITPAPEGTFSDTRPPRWGWSTAWTTAASVPTATSTASSWPSCCIGRLSTWRTRPAGACSQTPAAWKASPMPDRSPAGRRTPWRPSPPPASSKVLPAPPSPPRTPPLWSRRFSSPYGPIRSFLNRLVPGRSNYSIERRGNYVTP